MGCPPQRLVMGRRRVKAEVIAKPKAEPKTKSEVTPKAGSASGVVKVKPEVKAETTVAKVEGPDVTDSKAKGGHQEAEMDDAPMSDGDSEPLPLSDMARALMAEHAEARGGHEASPVELAAEKYYSLEHAKSGRSVCKGKCKSAIPKDELRFGSTDTSQGYDMTMWRCVHCVTGRQLENVESLYGDDSYSVIRGWNTVLSDEERRTVTLIFDSAKLEASRALLKKEADKLAKEEKRLLVEQRRERRERFTSDPGDWFDWKALLDNGELAAEPAAFVKSVCKWVGIEAVGTKAMLLKKLADLKGEEVVGANVAPKSEPNAKPKSLPKSEPKAKQKSEPKARQKLEPMVEPKSEPMMEDAVDTTSEQKPVASRGKAAKHRVAKDEPETTVVSSKRSSRRGRKRKAETESVEQMAAADDDARSSKRTRSAKKGTEKTAKTVKSAKTAKTAKPSAQGKVRAKASPQRSRAERAASRSRH